MRENNITYIRVAITILVVFFHALGYYTFDWPWGNVKNDWYTLFDRVINQYNMSIFVAISGYLYATQCHKVLSQSISYGIKKKFFRLMIPYIFWSCIQIIIFHSSLNFHSIFYGCLHLWFLLMLFNIFIIAYLSRYFLLKKQQKWLIVTIIILSFWAAIPNIPTLLCLDKMCRYAIFFVLGIYAARFPLDLHAYAIPIMSISIILVIALTGFISLGILNTFIRIVCCSAFIFALFQSTRNHSYKFPLWIRSLDENSIGIYIIHHIIIWGIVQQQFAQNILNNHIYLGPISLFIVALSGAWCISYLLLTNKYTSIVLGVNKL